MNVYGELTKAQLENLTADPAAAAITAGRIWWRTDVSALKFDKGGTIDTIAMLAAAQTFTNKTVGDSWIMTQIATPANPSAGFNKLYFKNDGNLYILNSAGVEALVVSGVSTLPVAAGGTGQVTLTNHGVLVGAGTTGITQLAAAAASTVLVGNGSTSDPSFSANPTLTSLTTSGGLVTTSSPTSGFSRVKADGRSISVNNGSTGTVTIMGVNGSGLFIIQEGNAGNNCLAYISFSNTVTFLVNASGNFATSNTASKTGLTFVSSTGVLSINNQTGSTDTYNIMAITL